MYKITPLHQDPEQLGFGGLVGGLQLGAADALTRLWAYSLGACSWGPTVSSH